MSEPTCIYVYGIVDGSSDDGALDGFREGTRLDVTPAGRIAAVHTEMKGAELAGVDAEVAERSPLAELARRHEEVVTALAARGAVLPVRLGTLFPGRDALVKVLQDGHAGLVDALDAVRGCAEWQVRVTRTAAPTAVTEPGETDPATVRGGSVYLLDRRRSRRRAVEQHERLCAVLEGIDQALSFLAKDSAGPLLAAGSARRRSYLVPDSERGAFVAIVEQGAAQLMDVGADVRLSGPMPAYSFADVRFGSATSE